MPRRQKSQSGGRKELSPARTPRDLLQLVCEELSLGLSALQMEQLARHFALLLRWNEKMNLTSVRQPQEVAERHFAESLFLVTLLSTPAGGLLVDVGSGAGFPGLPLKIAWPALETILLEPNQKKATFLREVIRACGLRGIEVRAERLDDATAVLAGRAALVTVRAVKLSSDTLAGTVELLAPGGQVALFVGEEAADQIRSYAGFRWRLPSAIPHSQRRVILIGQKA